MRRSDGARVIQLHFGLHSDDLRMRVLRDLPDHRPAVLIGHPVPRLDAPVTLDRLVEMLFEGFGHCLAPSTTGLTVHLVSYYPAMDEAESTGAPLRPYARVHEMMAADRASAGLGIELLEVGDGTARCRMTVRDDMANGYDIAHGGLVFSLADTAFACACNSWGELTVAAGAEITFVAAARVGDVLEAGAAVRTRFGRHGIYDITVRRGDEVIAEFRGRSHRPAPESSSDGDAAAGPARARPGISAVEFGRCLHRAVAYDATSMDDLARRLGVGKSAIYHHVESKEALLGLALDRALIGLERLADSVRHVRTTRLIGQARDPSYAAACTSSIARPPLRDAPAARARQQ